jgi:hypothetical protein
LINKKLKKQAVKISQKIISKNCSGRRKILTRAGGQGRGR